MIEITLNSLSATEVYLWTSDCKWRKVATLEGLGHHRHASVFCEDEINARSETKVSQVMDFLENNGYIKWNTIKL